MNDERQESAAGAEPSEPSPQVAKIRKFRFYFRVVLYSLLAVAVAAMVVDQLARRGSSQAWDAVQAKLDAHGAENAMSPLKVREMLDRQPIEIKDGKLHYEEIYSWRGALQSFRLRLVYDRATGSQKAETSAELSRAYLNQE